MKTKSVQIAGMGKYLPARVVPSHELEAQMGLPAGWIMEKSGVAQRHFVTDETIAYMGARALEKALEQAGLEYRELDLLISASGSYDYPIPDNACLIQHALGQENSGTPCWSIDSTCLSFLTALDTVSCLIALGRYQRVAIVSSEIASKSINYQEKESATLLGDGAAAAIVQATPPGEGSQVLAACMETYSAGAFHTYVKGGGNVLHPRHPERRDEDFTFSMNGPAVLGMAMQYLGPFLQRLFSQAGFPLQQLDQLVPHQASGAALAKGQAAMGLSDDQFMRNLSTHGNCIAASIPMALHDAIAQGRIQRGHRVGLLGTGAGLSLGGLVLVY